MNYKKIIAPIAPHLIKLQQKIALELTSDIGAIHSTAQKLINSEGKMIRPILLLVAYEHFKKIDDKAILGAAIIQLLHLATLVHDDVIDQANIRRNNKTANYLWGNKVAVLTGDYFLSISINNLNQLDNRLASILVAKCTKKIAQGEILQLTSTIESTDIDTYLKIIELKTAALISCAMELAAIIAKADKHHQQLMHKIGYNLGMAFQIIDDLLDYGLNTKKSDKQYGTDLFNKNLTLPVLYLLNQATAEHKKTILATLQTEEPQQFDLQTIINLLEEYDVTKYCIKAANKYIMAAKKDIALLPNSHNSILNDIANFIIERNL